MVPQIIYSTCFMRVKLLYFNVNLIFCLINGAVYVVKTMSIVNLLYISGNDYLNDITSQGQYTLRIDMEDFKEERRYAVYSSFAVGAEIDKYKLTLGPYSGNAGNDKLCRT